MSYQHCQADVVVEDKERVLAELQKKVVSLERRLQANLSQDEHLQELLQEVNHSFTLCDQENVCPSEDSHLFVIIHLHFCHLEKTVY